MQVLTIECPAEERERLAEFGERGAAGIIEEELLGGVCRLRAFFADRFEMPGAYWERAEKADWAALLR